MIRSIAWLVVLACGTASAQTVVREVHGSQPSEFLGWGSCLLPDLNGDGYADLVVGSPLKDTAAGVDSGFIQVLSGKDLAVLFAVDGPAADTWFGQVTSDAGDVDGDGRCDVIVGAVRHDANAKQDCGSVSVLSGAGGGLLWRFFGDAAFDAMGIAVAGAGDVDQDGRADLVYGGAIADGPNGVNCGEVCVRSGATGATLYAFYGDNANDNLGVCDGAGDVNADGYVDVVAGARWDDDVAADCGSARVYSGKDGSTLHTWFGSASGDNLGNVVAAAGDVDRDGFDDVIVGIWRSDLNGGNSGEARVYSGQSGAQLYQWIGESAGDGFGVFVDGAGDLDGDGWTDLAVGAFQDDVLFNNAGSVSAYSGKDGAELFKVGGVGGGDELGVIVHGGQDVDRNGFPDVIAGAYWNDQTGLNTGMARVYSACDGKALSYGTGCAGSGGFVPELHLVGCPIEGAAVELSISKALGGTSGLIFMGFGAANVPLGHGCSLLVAPLLNATPVPIPGAGAGNGVLSIPFQIPLGVAPATLTLQAAIVDAGVVQHFAVSAGLELGIAP